MDGAGLHQLVEGLATNGLLTHSHLLTGACMQANQLHGKAASITATQQQKAGASSMHVLVAVRVCWPSDSTARGVMGLLA